MYIDSAVWSVLQCVLQCVAVCCSVCWCVAVCCSVHRAGFLECVFWEYIGHFRVAIWGGYNEYVPYNYRSLLQKSPIKETIFCEHYLHSLESGDGVWR